MDRARRGGGRAIRANTGVPEHGRRRRLGAPRRRARDLGRVPAARPLPDPRCRRRARGRVHTRARHRVDDLGRHARARRPPRRSRGAGQFATGARGRGGAGARRGAQLFLRRPEGLPQPRRPARDGPRAGRQPHHLPPGRRRRAGKGRGVREAGQARARPRPAHRDGGGRAPGDPLGARAREPLPGPRGAGVGGAFRDRGGDGTAPGTCPARR
jgi:hypothetical protein